MIGSLVDPADIGGDLTTYGRTLADIFVNLLDALTGLGDIIGDLLELPIYRRDVALGNHPIRPSWLIF